MMISIEVEVDDGDPSADPDHQMGITSGAYDRLTIGVDGDGFGPLSWLGEVIDVKRVS